MKCTIPRWLVLSVLCLFGITTTFAQGTVVFDNRVPGTAISHVYLPLASNPTLTQIGNGVSDYPSGTTDWTGWTLVSGGGFSAQLFGAAGADVAADSLAPAFPVTTFRTGAYAGFVQPVTATFTGVPVNSLTTIQMRVWDNQGGMVTSWAAALAQPQGTELLGTSALINLYVGGGGPGPTPTLVGLQSFNLVYNVPEPSLLALFGVGALVLRVAFGKANNACHASIFGMAAKGAAGYPRPSYDVCGFSNQAHPGDSRSNPAQTRWGQLSQVLG